MVYHITSKVLKNVVEVVRTPNTGYRSHVHIDANVGGQPNLWLCGWVTGSWRFCHCHFCYFAFFLLLSCTRLWVMLFLVGYQTRVYVPSLYKPIMYCCWSTTFNEYNYLTAVFSLFFFPLAISRLLFSFFSLFFVSSSPFYVSSWFLLHHEAYDLTQLETLFTCWPIRTLNFSTWNIRTKCMYVIPHFYHEESTITCLWYQTNVGQ